MAHRSITNDKSPTEVLTFDECNGALVCPRCETSYLHHGDVVDFCRPEDDCMVKETTVHCGQATINLIPNMLSGNPSTRRDGLVVKFDCECCGDGLELTIAQHKGQTFMEWRIKSLGQQEAAE